MFLIKKILSLLLLPPLAPFLLIVLGLVLLPRWPRFGRILAWCGLFAAMLLTMPAGVQLLLKPLENMVPPTAQALQSAQAIVILGGGKTHNAPEYGGETVNRLSLERSRYGARLARQTGLPVLLSGGAPSRGTAEAALMREVLERDFGVKVRWVEDKSLDTRDNARYSAAILKPLGIHRVVLVSQAAHLMRARAEFIEAGLEVVLAPTGYLGGTGESPNVIGDFIPGPAAAYAGWYACHEWLGYLAWRLRSLAAA